MFKGYRVVHVATMFNGNTDRSPLTRWMSKADAFAFARTLKGDERGRVHVESKRGALYGIVVDHNVHAQAWGF